MKKHLTYLLFYALCIFGCKVSEYPGYSRMSEHIHYKLHTLGNESRISKLSDYVTLKLVYTEIDDEILFEGIKTVQINDNQQLKQLNHCLLMLTEQQEATFIIPKQWLYKESASESRMKVHIRLKEIKHKRDFEKEVERWKAWGNNLASFEKVLIEQYAADSNFSMDPSKARMVSKVLIEGMGEALNQGDTVIMHYEGKFLNGNKFDSTYERNQKFTYIVGQQYQLIKGLEWGVKRMKAFEKSIFLLPSNYAFGNQGSSSGIIPPYTPVIYEVEILEVRRRSKTSQ